MENYNFLEGRLYTEKQTDSGFAMAPFTFGTARLTESSFRTTLSVTDGMRVRAPNAKCFFPVWSRRPK
jgi:hypothetical protein